MDEIEMFLKQKREEIIKQIVNLHSLKNVQMQLSKFEKEYDQFFYDIFIILRCAEENVPYNVIELLLSKHKVDFKEYNENVYPLKYLLTIKNYTIFKLFMKYGFDINGTLKVNKDMEANLFFSESFNNNDDMENYCFLIENGIDIYYCLPHQILERITTHVEEYSVLDFIVTKAFDNSSHLNSFYSELLSFLLKHYYDINNKPILSLIYFAKDRKPISKNNFSEIITKHIKYIDFNKLHDYSYEVIASNDDSKILSNIIISVGFENIFPNFYNKIMENYPDDNIYNTLKKYQTDYTKKIDERKKKKD